MFARFRNQYLEHARGVWSSFTRASSRRSAWVKSPRKWRGGRFTTTRKAVGVVSKGKKKEKKEKKRSFLKAGHHVNQKKIVNFRNIVFRVSYFKFSKVDHHVN